MRKEMEMKEVIEISELATVNAIYDGFKIDVDIFVDSKDVECACYLYSKNTVISKSGYKNDRKHTFHVEENQNDYLKVKVFFKNKNDNTIKKSKIFPLSIRRNLRYKLSQNSLSSVNTINCEIIAAKPTAIEKYEKKGFQPRNDNTPYKLILPIDWLEDPFNDRNWMFQLHAWRMLDGYLNRSNRQDLYYVSQIINDWVSFEKDNKSKWLWYDMSTGLRALKISFYLKKCYDKGINHRIEDLDYLLHEHFRHLSNLAELNSGNHGLFQLHGLKSLTYVINDYGNGAYSMSDMKNYANDRMSKLITSQLGNHGVHTEDSPDYHFFTHKKITNIIQSPWWSDLNEKILKILELGENAKPWLVFPNKKCVPIGDSAVGSVRNDLVALDKWSHIKSGDYIGAQVDGYAIVRSLESVPLNNSSFLFFQGSFHSQAHKHCDDLSFILQENGIDLLIDSGKYGYQQDKYRKYFLSTHAHNTIEVDGKSTTRSEKYAYGSAIFAPPKCIDDVWVIEGKVEHVVNDYIHERTILYKPGLDLYVIDVITNKKLSMPRKIDQWWHFETDAKVTIEENKVVVNTSTHNHMEIASESSSKAVDYHLYKGYDSGNRLIGWVSKKYLQYEPTSALKISTSVRKRSIVLTRFKLSKIVLEEPVVSLLGKEIKVNSSYPNLSHFFSDKLY